jgi:hypothetical protein
MVNINCVPNGIKIIKGFLNSKITILIDCFFNLQAYIKPIIEVCRIIKNGLSPAGQHSCILRKDLLCRSTQVYNRPLHLISPSYLLLEAFI